MKAFRWTLILLALGFIGWIVLNDMKEQARAAEAMAWYRHSQVEEHKKHGNKEWKEFKECLQSGERLRNCAEQLD